MRRAAPHLAASGFAAIMAMLYLGGARPLYFAILRLWGVDPWPTPFLDTDTVMSALRCLRAGVDVLAANPCDPLARVYDYSPLWLVLARLPVTTAWVIPAGLAVDGAFLLSLLLLPAARSARGAVLVVLGVVSPPVVFALERGNNDLVLFTLAALAAVLVRRSPLMRAVGYGAALLAGLLKYYPMTLMALAVRERPRGFVLAALGSVLGIALFVVTMGHDLARALRLVPSGFWRGGMFGAPTVPLMLADITRTGKPVELAARAAMTLAALIIGWRWSRRPAFAVDLAALTDAERTALLAGALLILGCFLTAQNIAYRAIHLLFVLPALTTLAGERTRWRWVLGAVMLLLWSDAWRGGPDVQGHALHPTLALLLWLPREAMWWGVVTTFAAIAFQQLFSSETAAWALARLAFSPRPTRAERIA